VLKPRLLLLEDDPAIAGTIVFAFEREGYAVHHVLLVAEADAAVRREAPAAAVLDVGVPDGNGLDLCRRWRADADARLATLPVLMLTARGEEIDRVLGLEAGADDYLGKPFSPRELVARVRALLRRAAMPNAAQGHVASRAGSPGTPGSPGFAGFELDEAGQRIRYAGVTLALTRLEYRLLRELVLARGRILSREALLDRVWGTLAESTDRTVDTHVKTLRAKLREAVPGADPIATHRGLGYALAEEPSASAHSNG
jgi:two-component system, OmpR family, catabolic regulation response regulator CreB